jgi:hypothetical protein
MVQIGRYSISKGFLITLGILLPLAVMGKPASRWLKAQYDVYRGSTRSVTATPAMYRQLLAEIRQKQPDQQLTPKLTPRLSSQEDISERIFQAAIAPELLGRSSEFEPYTHNGRLACAVMVNRAIQGAVGRTIGQNPLYVPSIVAELDGGRGKRIAQAQTKRGDLAISNGTDYERGLWHIGICVNDGCRVVLSNSPTETQFNWLSDSNFEGAFAHYPGETTFYRLVQP